MRRYAEEQIYKASAMAEIKRQSGKHSNGNPLTKLEKVACDYLSALPYRKVVDSNDHAALDIILGKNPDMSQMSGTFRSDCMRAVKKMIKEQQQINDQQEAVKLDAGINSDLDLHDLPTDKMSREKITKGEAAKLKGAYEAIALDTSNPAKQAAAKYLCTLRAGSTSWDNVRNALRMCEQGSTKGIVAGKGSRLAGAIKRADKQGAKLTSGGSGGGGGVSVPQGQGAKCAKNRLTHRSLSAIGRRRPAPKASG